MKIEQFRYSADNLAYLVYGETSAIVIDGGATDKIRAFLKENGLTLTWAVNTHSHADHTVGTRRLIDEFGAEYLDPIGLAEKGNLLLDGETLQITATPGHTKDSICFYTGDALITGDTLFNGTVGNPFSGDLNAFYRSVKTILEYPDETIIYAGHDYVEESMAFAWHVDRDNPHIDDYLAAHDPDHVRSTLKDEKLVNPYLRFNEPSIISFLKSKRFSTETELDRWKGIMAVG